MAYSPRNTNGQATAANSTPVTLASDQTQDVLVTGAASQSTSGNNILLATAGSGSVDTMAGAAAYRTAIVQVVASSVSVALVVVSFRSPARIMGSVPRFDASRLMALAEAIRSVPARRASR